MPFQQICRTYQQNIQHTHAQNDATAELSLHPYLKTFLKNGRIFRKRNYGYVRAAKTGDW